MTDTAPITIVVVDDFPDGRDLMSTTLRLEGFDVKEAGTGEEALKLAADRPALMVLDVNLPDMDGFEVCRRIKSDPETAGVSVLQVSAAFRKTGDRVRGLDGGADAYLALPVEREELVATVRALLRIRRAERDTAGLRAVMHLANAAAHKINNPLAVVIGQLHFLAKDPAVPAARVQAIQVAAERIREIVQQMLRITKLELVESRPHVPDMLDLDRSSRPHVPDMLDLDRSTARDDSVTI
jgi:two-component system, sensor histidine kinase